MHPEVALIIGVAPSDEYLRLWHAPNGTLQSTVDAVTIFALTLRRRQIDDLNVSRPWFTVWSSGKDSHCLLAVCDVNCLSDCFPWSAAWPIPRKTFTWNAVTRHSDTRLVKPVEAATALDHVAVALVAVTDAVQLQTPAYVLTGIRYIVSAKLSALQTQWVDRNS